MRETSWTTALPAIDAMPPIARFAMAGVFVTALSSLIYLLLSVPLSIPPLAATVVSHLCGVIVGFRIHSRWSFHEARRHDGIERLLRFATGSAAALLLNGAWVWVLVDAFGAPAWAPVPAMVFVTPIASFVINRSWVFARS